MSASTFCGSGLSLHGTDKRLQCVDCGDIVVVVDIVECLDCRVELRVEAVGDALFVVQSLHLVDQVQDQFDRNVDLEDREGGQGRGLATDDVVGRIGNRKIRDGYPTTTDQVGQYEVLLTFKPGPNR